MTTWSRADQISQTSQKFHEGKRKSYIVFQPLSFGVFMKLHQQNLTLIYEFWKPNLCIPILLFPSLLLGWILSYPFNFTNNQNITN